MMQQLLEKITALVSILPPGKIASITSQMKTDADNDLSAVLQSVSATPVAEQAIAELIDALKGNSISKNELALMLSSASNAYHKAWNKHLLELVWTGPNTPFVSTRRTEQALLEVINAAEETLFIISFVAYEIPSIMKALKEAVDRGVEVSMLMELSRHHGGSIDIDALGKMQESLLSVHLYVWKEKGEGFDDGRVHAKTAIADSHKCFITSANLTGFAMERNMELGVLITGGNIPVLLQNHLRALIDTKLISDFQSL